MSIFDAAFIEYKDLLRLGDDGGIVKDDDCTGGKIGATLRIKLPKDFKIFDRNWLNPEYFK